MDIFSDPVLSKVIQGAIWLLVAAATTALFVYLIRKLVGKILPASLEGQVGEIKKSITRISSILVAVILLIIIFPRYIAERDTDFASIFRAVADWLSNHGAVILFLVLAGYIVVKILKFVLPVLMLRVVKAKGENCAAHEEVVKRADILSRFAMQVIVALVGLVLVFTVMSEIGIDIGPLLAGAGVVGIAVGLGAQRLVGDTINGIIIMGEDYYSVGDVVKVADIAGLVEDLNIRRTVLRDLDGIVHIIPNGEIKTASNYTRNWSRVNINIPVAYGEDLDKVIKVLNKVGNELAADSHFRQMIITPPQVLRVDNFGDSAIEIKMLGETKPIKQWDVTGELRKRVKKAFDMEGIEIPWPHTKVFFGNIPPSFPRGKEENMKKNVSQPPGMKTLKKPLRRKKLPPDSESD